MLLLDKELRFIEVNEPDVVAVHHSLDPIAVVPEGHKQQLCDACLCVTREKGEERTFAALYLTGTRETLVYTHTAPVSASEGIVDALAFLEAMGFIMKECNLKGSSALREVVIRSIKAFQPPQAYKKALAPAGVSMAPLESAAPHDEHQTPSAPGGTDLSNTTAAAHAEPEEMVAEHTESDRAPAIGPRADDTAAQRELGLLQEKYEALHAEYMLINEELTSLYSNLQQKCCEKYCAGNCSKTNEDAPGKLPNSS